MVLSQGVLHKASQIATHLCRELGFAKASIDSRSGRISSHWHYSGDLIHYEFEIPDGTTAYLTLPSGRTEVLTHGTHSFTEPEPQA